MGISEMSKVSSLPLGNKPGEPEETSVPLSFIHSNRINKRSVRMKTRSHMGTKALVPKGSNASSDAHEVKSIP